MAASGPYAVTMRCTTPPVPGPMVALHSVPCSSTPFSMSTYRSAGSSGPTAAAAPRTRFSKKIPDGSRSDTSCFPVQYGAWAAASKPAAGGTSVFPGSLYRTTPMHCCICRLVSRVAARVMSMAPTRASCTKLRHGALVWGFMTFRDTAMSSRASASAGKLCRMCRFISSPSQSALYGPMTPRGTQNASPATRFNRCAMNDSLCRDGWRLKHPTSPSNRCRSTMSPVCRRTVDRSSIRCSCVISPDTCSTRAAPPVAPGPTATALLNHSMFRAFTSSGFVSVFMKMLGTPSWSTSSTRSGLMTDRAFWSVRLATMLHRKRPCFPDSRLFMAFLGTPVRCRDCGAYRPPLSLMTVTSFCRRSHSWGCAVHICAACWGVTEHTTSDRANRSAMTSSGE